MWQTPRQMRLMNLLLFLPQHVLCFVQNLLAKMLIVELWHWKARNGPQKWKCLRTKIYQNVNASKMFKGAIHNADTVLSFGDVSHHNQNLKDLNTSQENPSCSSKDDRHKGGEVSTEAKLLPVRKKTFLTLSFLIPASWNFVAVFCSISSEFELRATLAPSLANSRAVASPIPLLAPVKREKTAMRRNAKQPPQTNHQKLSVHSGPWKQLQRSGDHLLFALLT